MRSLRLRLGEEGSKPEDIANRECNDRRRKLHGLNAHGAAAVGAGLLFDDVVQMTFGSRSRDPCRRAADFETQAGVRGGGRPRLAAAKAVRFLAFFS
jgi:hypothetical protein